MKAKQDIVAGKRYKVLYFGSWMTVTAEEDKSVKEKFFRSKKEGVILFDEVDDIR